MLLVILNIRKSCGMLFVCLPSSVSDDPVFSLLTRSLPSRFNPGYSRGFSRERKFPCTIRYLTHFRFFPFIIVLPFSLTSSERFRLISNERRRCTSLIVAFSREFWWVLRVTDALRRGSHFSSLTLFVLSFA